MKTCTKCRAHLPSEKFSRHKRSKDGLQAWCKDCQSVALKANRERRASEPARAPSTKRCPRCEATKASAQFHRHRTSPDGLQPYCAECSLLIRREWAVRNAEAVAAKQAEKIVRASQRTDGVKACTRCGETKPMLDFYLHRGTRDGRATHCAPCQRARTREWNAANREKIKERNATYAAANPERRKRDHRQFWLKMYGLDQDSYAALLDKQGGACAICQLPERVVDARTGELRRLAVDHCHTTGRVRGLLCARCNRSIGQFADDPERLSRAAAYLREAAE